MNGSETETTVAKSARAEPSVLDMDPNRAGKPHASEHLIPRMLEILGGVAANTGRRRVREPPSAPRQPGTLVHIERCAAVKGARMAMEGPISPPPVTGGAGRELPAYLSNGVVGLKIRDNPLSPGMTLLSGFSGEHPERKIEAAAFAPYPIAGDVGIDGVWMSEAPQSVRIVDQACDFSAGELTTRLQFEVNDHRARITVMAFCSRDQPTIVCQEISIKVDTACDIRIRAKIDLSSLEGRALRYNRDTPGEVKPSCDGWLLWESAGAMSTKCQNDTLAVRCCRLCMACGRPG
jgi:hypothetical protein